jgi:hypothetical protein
MARLIVGATFGLVVGTIFGAALGLHADSVDAEVVEAAAVAHVNATDLQGAVNSTGADPFDYLRGTGELPPLPSEAPPKVVSVQPPPGSSRVACIVAHESQGDPSARNRSGAAGLGQFLPGTWATTPQGRAGLSVYNPAANRAAISWMISVGRAHEFVAVSAYGC